MLKPLGESAILIEWPAVISDSILEDILALQAALEAAGDLYPIETWNAYHALTVAYDPSRFSFSKIKERIKNIYGLMDTKYAPRRALWKIPVCYDGEFGIDLEMMALDKGMGIHEIIARHCSVVYTVYFIGFLPGFLYLGGLPDDLHFPRKATPRLKISRGAVAIGGPQTGVYPIESPGGWNIIGNSPLAFFDSTIPLPCFARAGDKIQFYPIDRTEHDRIAGQVRRKEFTMEQVWL